MNIKSENNTINKKEIRGEQIKEKKYKRALTNLNIK